MSVGLFDDDIFKYGQVPFNLELMKLSSYFKAQREIVILSRELKPYRYSQFFFRKDYYDGTYPTEIAKEKNVNLGGYAFHPNEYIPLDEIIEARPADKTIYKKYADFFIKNKDTKAAFKSMYNATHIRLSWNGFKVSDKYERQIIEARNKAFFIHDLNAANIDGARSIIKDLLTMGRGEEKVRIGVKFPIKIYNNPAQLKEWISFPTMNNYYPIHYYGLLSDEDFVDIFNTPSKNILKQFIYYPFHEKDYEFVKEKINNLILQMMYARGCAHPIRVNVEMPFWEDLVQFLNEYIFTQSGYKKGKPYLYFTPFHYVKIKKKNEGQEKRFLQNTISVNEIRQIFTLLQKENYEAFKLLYECAHSKYENGRLVPCVG